MVEKLRPGDPEKKPPLWIRNPAVAHLAAMLIDWRIGDGLTEEGHRLLKDIIVRAMSGKRVSAAIEVPRIFEGAKLEIHIDGQEHIPFGPTILIGNHIDGGPLRGLGQYFAVVSAGRDARFTVDDDSKRDPFLIAQRGLGKKGLEFLSGAFYEVVVGDSFGFEIVAIPRHDRNGQILNRQGISTRALRRLAGGGAAVLYPQGRFRDPEDFDFPDKTNKFLTAASHMNESTQLVPTRSRCDPGGNMRITFGEPVETGEVLANGGINYFAEKHLAPLK